MEDLFTSADDSVQTCLTVHDQTISKGSTMVVVNKNIFQWWLSVDLTTVTKLTLSQEMLVLIKQRKNIQKERRSPALIETYTLNCEKSFSPKLESDEADTKDVRRSSKSKVKLGRARE